MHEYILIHQSECHLNETEKLSVFVNNL